MDTIRLGYGDSDFEFSYQSDRFQVIAPVEHPAAAPEEHLVESAPLEALARGKEVLVIVSDLTRPTGTREFLPRLLPRLEHASAVRILFATGIHRPLGDEDKIAIVGEDVFRGYPMLDHQPDSHSTALGETSFGNRVEISSHVLGHELVVLTGAIGFHYYAGFSGGRKSLLPGVASKASIEFNHLLVLNQSGPGRNPNARVARLDGNPVHEDMMEGARLVGRNLFLYNTILDKKKKVWKIYSGHWEAAHRRGAEDYFRHHSVPIPERRAWAIASCGGFPRDINMIQAHKALEFAQYAVDPGGTIVLLAECREGTGHPTFFPWFKYEDLAEFERQLRARYEVYGQTAYSLYSKTRRFLVICVSALDGASIRAMGMEPARDLESALAMVDPNTAAAPGYILPFGAEVLPAVEG